MCALQEIIFSLWCTRLLASLVCRYGQKVTPVKKWVKCMPGKNNHLQNSSPSCSSSTHISHYICSTDKHETW